MEIPPVNLSDSANLPSTPSESVNSSDAAIITGAAAMVPSTSSSAAGIEQLLPSDAAEELVSSHGAAATSSSAAGIEQLLPSDAADELLSPTGSYAAADTEVVVAITPSTPSAATMVPSTSSGATLNTTAAAGIEQLLPSTSSVDIAFTPSAATTTPSSSRNSFVLSLILIILIIYLLIGILFYCIYPDNFSGIKTNQLVDGLYYTMVTFGTVGYGDIVPVTPLTKLLCCFFIFFGAGPINTILFNSMDFIINSTVNTELMEMRKKVACAICILLFWIGVGTIAIHIIEDLDWVDSMYLSMISVTTVGYGEHTFKTIAGRLFAFCWLLLSLPMVNKAIQFLGKALIDNCYRRIA